MSYEQAATTQKYVLDDLMRIANFEIKREMNARTRVRVANYWIDRLIARFPEQTFAYDSMLNIVIGDVKREVVE